MTPIEILFVRAPCYKPGGAHIIGMISLAEEQTSATAYGDLRSDAVALLALHWLALEERGRTGAAGAIVSESEGELSRAYSAPPQGSSDLSLTTWGLLLESLGKKTSLSFINRRFGAF